MCLLLAGNGFGVNGLSSICHDGLFVLSMVCMCILKSISDKHVLCNCQFFTYISGLQPSGFVFLWPMQMWYTTDSDFSRCGYGNVPEKVIIFETDDTNEIYSLVKQIY